MLGIRLRLRKLVALFKLTHNSFLPVGSSSTEVAVPNRNIRNAEVQVNDVAINDEVLSTHWPKDNRLDADNSDGAGRGFQNFEFEGLSG